MNSRWEHRLFLICMGLFFSVWYRNKVSIIGNLYYLCFVGLFMVNEIF